MPVFRTEQDSLGPIKVPKNALFGAQTARAIENFHISGRTVHPAILRAYLRVKAAAARANAQAGVLSQKETNLILRAIGELLQLDENAWRALFPIDPYQAGAGTSQNMNINEVVANVANRLAGKPLGTYHPIHPNDHVNRSQSTNDTYPTAMRLALLETSKPLIRALEQLSGSFAIKAHAWKDIPKSARTHLQDAVPMRLGQEFGAYALTIGKCAGLIRESQEKLRELGIGGSAAGTSLTVPRTYLRRIVPELAKLTGERLRANPDLREAMQSQAPVLFHSSMLRLTSVELTRICNDLRLLASGPSTGFAEILLPAVQPGSSIMPGKVNPSILEMVNQACFSVIGHDQTVALAVQAGQLELNVMMPIMAYSLLEATTILSRACDTLRLRCIDGMQANEKRLRRYFESTPQVATALSPRLGYDTVAKLVKEALAEERSVMDLVRERKLVPETELRGLLALERLLGTASPHRKRSG